MNKKKHSRFDTARKILIFWCLFVGIGAVAGAAAMIIDPSGKAMGMDAMLPYFAVLPFANVLFRDLTFSGWALLIVNGITNLTAAALLLCKKRCGAVLGCIFGVTLMLWICIQFYMFPLNFMSTAFFIFGLCQAATGYAALVFYKQEQFSVSRGDYPNIGTNPKNLVVFFSRMGYVRKLAYEEANRTGAAVYEIEADEKTDGTLGFWWCGRYGMHHWDMPIKPVTIDPGQYEHITVCSPIWVFSVSAPVKAFCREFAGKIKSADYILVHHTSDLYEKAADELDDIACIKRSGLRSIRCRKGVYKPLS